MAERVVAGVELQHVDERDVAYRSGEVRQQRIDQGVIELTFGARA